MAKKKRWALELSRHRRSCLFTVLVVEADDEQEARKQVADYLREHEPGHEEYSYWHLGEDAYGLRWQEESFQFEKPEENLLRPFVPHDEDLTEQQARLVDGKIVEITDEWKRQVEDEETGYEEAIADNEEE
jgi:hypothetical protein